MKKTIPILILLSFLSLSGGAQSRTTVNVAEGTITVSFYTDKEVILDNKTDLHITNTTTPLSNSIVKLNTQNSWLFFDNIRPQSVINNLLQYVYVNGNAAVNNSNCRVVIYKQGTVVIPQGVATKPLTVYSGQNYTGDSTSFSLFNYYTSLSSFENRIRSFKLKRGYMATVATESNGLGYSRVFIADDQDIDLAELPELLDESISFIRVFTWEYVSKKGWAGSDFNQYNLTNSTWRYDWSAGGSTTSYVEYVPIRQNGGWPSWSEINSKTGVTHVLGFNEPDHTEQSNLTVAEAVQQWPNMLASGLRVGSPACTNFSWLYQFMDSCKAHNYRVDYVAVHAYWGGKSPANWYNDLKYIHTRTGRPIWITEWNNGANWTTEYWPTSDHSLSTANAAKQLSDIKAILNVLDTASFIERYSIYNWVQDCRAMVLSDTLTPAGKYYAADNAPMAFNRDYEVVPEYQYQTPTITSTFGSKTVSIVLSEPNTDYYDGSVVEKQVNDSEFVEYASLDKYTKTFTDNIDISVAKTNYRLKVKYRNGTTLYTKTVGMNVTEGDDIQYGNIYLDNVDWNSIYFRKGFSSIPTIILGGITNQNSTVYMTPRARLVSSSSRFNLQLAPWDYQNVTSLTKEDAIPYFVCSTGSHDFGGLKALAGRVSGVTAKWTKVTFDTPFETVPVVFASQLSPANTFATMLRIRNVTETGFEVKLMKETAVTTALSTETITYLAVTEGVGSVNGKKLIVGRTADNTISTTSYTNIDYGDSIASPVFITQLQTCTNDTVTATLRCLSISTKFANVLKQRERSTGIYFSSEKDAAGWMVLEENDMVNALESPVSGLLGIYPNPVRDFIRTSNYSTYYADIYNLCGVKVKQAVFENGRADVSDLQPGTYIIRTKDFGSDKFVKL
ncbi:MAG: glycosyl hydrolase [Paludibacter sp.]|nr:glycosyl hydrolase [Paludibacter sp.]